MGPARRPAGWRQRPRVLAAAVCTAVSAALVAACGSTAPVAGAGHPTRSSSSDRGAGVAPAHPGRDWILTRAALTAVLADPTDRRAIGSGRVFEILRGAQQPASGLDVVPTESFASYGALRAAVVGGTLPADIRAVVYDAESWALTPAREQRDPARYYALAGRLAHAHGLLLVATPALDLAKGRAGAGGTLADAFLALHLAAATARSADVFEVQAQSLERSPGAYAGLVAAAAAQARSAHAGIPVLAGVSANPPGGPVSTGQVVASMEAVAGRVQGYWLNIPGAGARCPTCGPPRPAVIVGALAAASGR